MKKIAIAAVLAIIAVQAIGAVVTTKNAGNNLHSIVSHRMAQIDNL